MNKLSRLLKNPLVIVTPIVLALLVIWQQYTLYQPQIALPQSNILPNANLDELDGHGFPIGWQLSRASAKVTASTAPGHISPSLLVLNNASDVATGNTTLTSPIASVQPGERYFYKAFYTSTVPFDLIVKSHYADGTHDQMIVNRYDPNTQWETASYVLLPRQNVQSVQFIYSLAAEGELRIDNTYLEPNPPDLYLEPKPALGPNRIPNAQLMTTDGVNPDGWSKFTEGNNQATLELMSDRGMTFMRSQVADYKTGEAKWQYDPIEVSGGRSFQYDVTYQSDTNAKVIVEYVTESETRQFEVLKDLLPAKEWTKYSETFEVPAGIKSITVTVVQQKNGRVDTKDFGLYDITKPGTLVWDKPRLSFTFDDGWESAYSNGSTLLNIAGYEGTFYLNPSTIDTNNFMSSEQVAALVQNGHEIGSHGYEHLNFTTLNRQEINYQFEHANNYFRQIHNIDKVNFASPFGEGDAQTRFYAQKYYSSMRSTETGVNTKQNFSPYDLRVMYLGDRTTTDEINAMIADAKAKNGWLILVYHRVESTGEGESIHPAQFQRHIDTVKKSGIAVAPLRDVLQEIEKQ